MARIFIFRTRPRDWLTAWRCIKFMVEEIILEPGQRVLFPEVSFGDAEEPDIILDNLEDTDVQVTFEEGTVTIKNLCLFLEEGESDDLAFADFESGGIISSLDDFLATAAGGPGGDVIL